MMDDTIDTNAAERYFTCVICKGYFKNPRLLPCSHAFCRDCIKELYKRRENTTNECACPICRGNFVLDYRGVDGLQPFFQAQGILSERCIDNGQDAVCEHCQKRPVAGCCRTCREDICKKCIERHREYDDLRKHETVLYTGNERLSEKFVSKNFHNRFMYPPTIRSTEEYDKLRKMKNALVDLQSQMEFHFKKLKNRAISFKEEKERSKSEIRSHIRLLKSKLDEEEVRLMDKLNDDYENERSKFQQQSERVKGWTKDVNDVLGRIMSKLYDEPESPDGPTLEELFRTFDRVTRYGANVEKLDKTIEIMFLPSNNFSSDQNCSLGEIKVLKLPNSVPGSTNGRSPRPLSQLIQSTPPFKPTHRRAYSAGACLQSLITSKPVEIDPPPAPHYPSYSSSGSSFTDGKGKITGIAISSDSTMYVINSTLKECHHFELDGSLLGTFRGTLKDPLDVAIYTDDDGIDVVLVTDHGESNHGIKVMKTDGGSGQRDFRVLTDHPIKPMGITVMSSGSEKPSGVEILTCDAEDKLIKVYNKQGESLRCIGQNYSTLFKWPLYMTIFKMKYLVITDNCLQTVFIIDMDTDNIIARIQHENFTPAKTCVLPDGSILIGDNSHTVAHKATTNILNERRKNREIQSTMMFSSEPIALAANKDFLCVGCKDGSIHAISMNATLSLVQKSEGTKEYFV